VDQRVGRGISLLFYDRGTRRSAARPGRTLPPGKIQYPSYRRLGWSQGQSGRAENLVPTGIRSRTVQTVVSRYTLYIYIYIYIYKPRFSKINFYVYNKKQSKPNIRYRNYTQGEQEPTNTAFTGVPISP